METFYSDSAWLCLGKVFNYKDLDRGGNFDYHEVRIYDKALSQDELDSLRPQAENPGENPGGDPNPQPGGDETDEGTVETTRQPSDDEQPGGDNTTGADVTEADTTGTDDTTGGGCGSVVVGFPVVVALAAGMVFIRKKKADR